MKTLILLSLIINFLLANAKVLVYHRFGDTRYQSTNVDINVLKKHFNYIRDNNYKVVSLKDIVDKVDKKEAIPNNWVAISIDDNFKSFYENAFELFKKHKYPFTIFIYAKATNDRYNDYMTWEQLKEVAKYADIGVHSYSHSHLTRLSKKKLKEDIYKSHKLIKNKLNLKEILFYTYPYGEYNEEIKNLLIKKGYKAIFNQNAGAIAKFSEIYDLDRIGISNDSDLEKKLNIKALNGKIISPSSYPNDKIIKTLKVRLPKNIKEVMFYSSGYPWKKLKVTDGKINLKLNRKILNYKTRLIIKTKNNERISKILVKGNNNKK